MKYLFIKYKKNLYLFIKFELLRLQYKYIYFNTRLPFFIRSDSFFKYVCMSRDSSIVKLRNICLLSGRFKSVFKVFQLSRFSIKMEQYKGNLTGLKKISW